MKTGSAPPAPDVTIYTTPTCTYCNMAKAYLQSKGVAFKEIDVSKDQEKAREMVRKSQQMGVPVLEINGRIIVGFNKPVIDDALTRQKPVGREAYMNNLLFDPFSQ
ncbi:MAG: Uxx-star family glutaredoxin-like (seleno)protein [Candidatus Micrarchaeota archaeon]